MDRAEVVAKVNALILEITDGRLTPENLSPIKPLKEYMESKPRMIDSLDLLEITEGCKDIFGDFPELNDDAEMEALTCINDLYDLIDRLVNTPSP